MRSEVFWLLARLSEGASPRVPVTELKRRQKLKIPLPHRAAGARYRIDGNALIGRAHQRQLYFKEEVFRETRKTAGDDARAPRH
jgi:hypothetical protein